MRELDLGLEMQPATMDDAEIVADLETAREPEDPRDPTMLRFWWSSRAPDEAHTEMVAETNGEAVVKYATVAQAIAIGAKRVRTNNDGKNAPILHLNTEMGYRLVDPLIELHRELGT